MTLTVVGSSCTDTVDLHCTNTPSSNHPKDTSSDCVDVEAPAVVAAHQRCGLDEVVSLNSEIMRVLPLMLASVLCRSKDELSWIQT